MANANKPSGLTPVNNLNAAAWNNKVNVYSIPAAYSGDLYIGDPVTLSGTATATTGVPEIKLLAGGDSSGDASKIPVGVIVGLGKGRLIANPTNLEITYRPSLDAAIWYALVVDDPNTVFEVQDIGTGTPLTYTDVGSTINLVAGTGNGFVSGWLLNNASKGTTATYQMKILGLARRSDNAVGQYSKWLCKFNVHMYAAGALGI